MIKSIMRVFEQSKDMRVPRITEAKIDFSKEGIPLSEDMKIIGTDADVAMCLRFAEKDARINNRRMFPRPEPEFIEEDFMIDEPVVEKPVEKEVKR